MSRHYKIVGLEWIAKTQLKPHPEAAMPMGQDDAAALQSSIKSGGLIQPLLVLSKADKLDGFFQVVDGINRMESDPPDGKFPCNLIECDNVREVALECLGTGRKRSTGQRILAFLMMHKREVLKAAEIGAQIAAGKGGPVSNETGLKYGVFADFTADAMAERLKVCKEDVVRTVELFRCLEEKRLPDSNRGGERALDMKDPEDKQTFDDLKKVFGDVMAGGTAVRTWKPALFGRRLTTGPKGRPDVDFEALFRKGLNHLRTVFKAEAWHGIGAVERERLAELFDEVVSMLPEELMVRLLAAAAAMEAKKKAERDEEKKRKFS